MVFWCQSLPYIATHSYPFCGGTIPTTKLVRTVSPSRRSGLTTFTWKSSTPSALEGVMNLGSETVASWHDDSKTIPKQDYERLPTTLAGLHFLAFACLFLHQAAGILGAGP